MRPSWIKIIVSLVALWLVVAGVMWVFNARKLTAEKVAAFVEAQPLEGKSEADRKRFIEQVAEKVNALDATERKHSRATRVLDDFWKSLTAAERVHYLNLVLPKGMKVMIEAFNKMDSEKRKREVAKAIANLQRDGEGETGEDVDPALTKRIIEEGLQAFYSEASIEAKMDAMPFLEALEKNFKWKQ
jgi:hypothetical protein